MYAKWRHCYYISLFTVYAFAGPLPPPWHSTYFMDGCYALKSSNSTVESDGEILFNGLLLTANAGHLTATLLVIWQQNLIIKHAKYRLKSSNQETVDKIIKLWKTTSMSTVVTNTQSKYTINEENTHSYSFAACQIIIIRKLEPFLSTNQIRSGVKGRWVAEQTRMRIC